MTWQELSPHAQKCINAFIRKRDISKGCISCKISFDTSQIAAGHWVPEHKSFSLRFNLKNIHGQCPACNNQNYGMGATSVFGMIERFGSRETFQRLLYLNRVYSIKLKPKERVELCHYIIAKYHTHTKLSKIIISNSITEYERFTTQQKEKCSILIGE